MTFLPKDMILSILDELSSVDKRSFRATSKYFHETIGPDFYFEGKTFDVSMDFPRMRLLPIGFPQHFLSRIKSIKIRPSKYHSIDELPQLKSALQSLVEVRYMAISADPILLESLLLSSPRLTSLEFLVFLPPSGAPTYEDFENIFGIAKQLNDGFPRVTELSFDTELVSCNLESRTVWLILNMLIPNMPNLERFNVSWELSPHLFDPQHTRMPLSTIEEAHSKSLNSSISKELVTIPAYPSHLSKFTTLVKRVSISQPSLQECDVNWIIEMFPNIEYLSPCNANEQDWCIDDGYRDEESMNACRVLNISAPTSSIHYLICGFQLNQLDIPKLDTLKTYGLHGTLTSALNCPQLRVLKIGVLDHDSIERFEHVMQDCLPNLKQLVIYSFADRIDFNLTHPGLEKIKLELFALRELILECPSLKQCSLLNTGSSLRYKQFNVAKFHAPRLAKLKLNLPLSIVQQILTCGWHLFQGNIEEFIAISYESDYNPSNNSWKLPTLNNFDGKSLKYLQLSDAMLDPLPNIDFPSLTSCNISVYSTRIEELCAWLGHRVPNLKFLKMDWRRQASISPKFHFSNLLQLKLEVTTPNMLPSFNCPLLQEASIDIRPSIRRLSNPNTLNLSLMQCPQIHTLHLFFGTRPSIQIDSNSLYELNIKISTWEEPSTSPKSLFLTPVSLSLPNLKWLYVNKIPYRFPFSNLNSSEEDHMDLKRSPVISKSR